MDTSRWKMFKDRFSKGARFDLYFLIGEKNGNLNNFSVMTTDKWTEEKKITFLRNLYIKD